MDEVSRNYASALFSSLSPKERNDALEALTAFYGDLQSDPKFKELLSSYNLSPKEKREAIERIYGKSFSSIPHLIPFLYLVSDRHRIRDFGKILDAYRTLVNAENGVKEGIVYSAEKLSKAQMDDIQAAIGKRVGSQVCLKNIVDSRLLGGVKVAIDGKIFDGSVAAKLQGLARNLKGGFLS